MIEFDYQEGQAEKLRDTGSLFSSPSSHWDRTARGFVRSALRTEKLVCGPPAISNGVSGFNQVWRRATQMGELRVKNETENHRSRQIGRKSGCDEWRRWDRGYARAQER